MYLVRRKLEEAREVKENVEGRLMELEDAVGGEVGGEGECCRWICAYGDVAYGYVRMDMCGKVWMGCTILFACLVVYTPGCLHAGLFLCVHCL